MARILVIDDNDLFCASVKDLLEANGYDVALAVDGEDGIGQFQQQSFDLVLCDVFMPKKVGMETIREIRRLSAGTPIISMTGHVARAPDGGGEFDTDFLRMTRELGATWTIAKPFKIGEFLAVVLQCLATAAPTPRART